MWFSLTIKSVGIEKANEINRKAARSMAIVEAKRLLRLLAISEVNNIHQLYDFLQTILSLFPDDILQGDYSILGEDTLHFETKKCFAFEGRSIGYFVFERWLILYLLFWKN